MKLKRLKLHSPFRSLHDGFEVYFLREFDYGGIEDFGPYCVVGRNGSGKSNILEVLAAIFYHIECIYLDYSPKSFEKQFNEEDSYPEAYELEYYAKINEDEEPASGDLVAEYDLNHIYSIKIVKRKNERPEVSGQINLDNTKEWITLNRKWVKAILPQYIVGYSSGENEILSLPFFKMRFIQFDEYNDKRMLGDNYQRPENRFTLVDGYYNQAVLLCIYMLMDKSVLDIFEEEVGIKDIKSFRLIIRQGEYIDADKEISGYPFAESFEDPPSVHDYTNNIPEWIEKLKRCSTCHYFNHDTNELFLDYHVNKSTTESFRRNYNNEPFKLFTELTVLLNLNYYQIKSHLKEKIYHSSNIYLTQDVIPVPYDEERIMRFKDFELIKKGADGIIYTRSLSDGEYQLMHSIGLCLLFRNTNSLFLLDEPETHFNPDWRAKFISVLEKCFNGTSDKMRDMLITSHSPFIISDSKEEKILVFKKEEDVVRVERPGFKTFGASVNKITMKVFGKTETIGDYSLEMLDKLYVDLEEAKSTAQKEKLIEQANEKLGDSVEKILFVNKASE